MKISMVDHPHISLISYLYTQNNEFYFGCSISVREYPLSTFYYNSMFASFVTGTGLAAVPFYGLCAILTKITGFTLCL